MTTSQMPVEPALALSDTMRATIVVGPDGDTKAQLRAEFAAEAKHYRRRAAEAADMGERERARTFLAVAQVCESVAEGRSL